MSYKTLTLQGIGAIFCLIKANQNYDQYLANSKDLLSKALPVEERKILNLAKYSALEAFILFGVAAGCLIGWAAADYSSQQESNKTDKAVEPIGKGLEATLELA